MNVALIVALSLAAVPPALEPPKPVVRPATPEDAVAPPAQEHDPEAPPAGSREDRALWTSLRDGTALSNVELARVVQSSYRIRYGGYYEALHGHEGERAPQAEALTARLVAAVRAAEAAVPERPGVFQCRHVLLDFGQRMDAPKGSALAKELPGVRGEARACDAKMTKLLGGVRPAADEIDATLAAIDVWLGRARPVPPAGGKQPAASESANAALVEALP